MTQGELNYYYCDCNHNLCNTVENLNGFHSFAIVIIVVVNAVACRSDACHLQQVATETRFSKPQAQR